VVASLSSNPCETQAEHQLNNLKMAAAVVVCMLVVTLTWAEANPVARPMDREAINPLQLSTFKGYQYDYNLGDNGAYKFYYRLPEQSRAEERDENGDVRGSYSFVAPEGNEFDFKYQADREGFKVQSNALPESPQDTDEVKRAKEEFFKAYNKALDLASTDDDGKSYYDYEEKSDEGSEEESDESSEEDDDHEESSEESSEEDDDEESSEESSEESDEDDDDDEKKEKLNRSLDSLDKFGLAKQIRRTKPQKSAYQKLAKPVSTKKPVFARPTSTAAYSPKAQGSAARQFISSRGTKRTSRGQYYYARN